MQTLWLDRGCELSQAIQTILKGEIREKKKIRVLLKVGPMQSPSHTHQKVRATGRGGRADH